MGSNQTAVEWLWDKLLEETETGELKYHLKHDVVKVFEEALAMEREQIVSAVHYGIRSPYTNIQTIHPQVEMTKGEQYYEQTYGTEPSR